MSGENRASSSLKAREVYELLTSLVVPRPIAWVTTMDGAHVNLAPFSYFTGLGSAPPMVTIGISDKRDGAAKDTLRIAQKTGFLCINLVEEHDAERMNASSGDYAADVSETEALAINTVPCAVIPGVRVASSRAALECKLVDVHPYGDKVKVNLVVCEVLSFYLDDAIVDFPHDVRPVSRLGKSWYARLGERFSLERP